MTPKPIPAPWSTRNRLRGLAGIQLLMLIIVPVSIFPFASTSDFVVLCPSQYAPWVLSILVAGLLSTITSYIGVILIYNELKVRTKLVLGLAILPISALCYMTWTGKFTESRLDRLAAWTVALSLCGILGSFLESHPWDDEKREEWRQTLLFVDLPLLLIAIAMVAFKYLAYDWSTNEFNKFVTERFPRPGSRTPEWERLQRQFLEIIRSVFWIGFSAGVVTAQLIVSQLSSVWVRLRVAVAHSQE